MVIIGNGYCDGSHMNIVKEEKLNMSKYKIKKTYKVEIKDKK